MSRVYQHTKGLISKYFGTNYKDIGIVYDIINHVDGLKPLKYALIECYRTKKENQEVMERSMAVYGNDLAKLHL